MNGLYFIPDEQALTSMEAFRCAITNNEGLRAHYLDDLAEIYKDDDEEWHKAFMYYHDLLMDCPIMDHPQVAIGISSNGFWADDLRFIIINDNLSIKLVP